MDEVLELARRFDRRLALLVGERLDDLVLVLGDEVDAVAENLSPRAGRWTAGGRREAERRVLNPRAAAVLSGGAKPN